MKNEKLCEYLSDIGILPFDNIDLFFQIYSSNNSKIFNSEREKLKNSLFLYLKKTSENENNLKEISNHIIEGYYNSYIINNYKNLTILFNLLRLKFFSHYNYFITRISSYIIKKAKFPLNFIKLKEEENISKNKLKRNKSDDLILRKEKKSEGKNKKDEENKNKEEKENKKIQPKKKKKIAKIKKMNKYKNNWYKNINDEGVVQHGFFVNNNDDLNKYNNIDNYNDIDLQENNFKNLKYNNFNYAKYDEEINNSNNEAYNSPNFDYNSKKSKLHFNYYTPMYNHYNKNDVLYNDNPDFIENIQIPSNHYINDININSDSNIESEEKLKHYDFFESQEKHEKKVKNKIFNLQNEKLKNIEKECTFTPKINSPLSQRAIQKYIVDNKFEKLYNDSIMNKIKKEQKIKKSLEEFKFKPDLKETENYVVLTTFEERLNRSINKKNQKNGNLKNNKKNKNKKKEIKNSVINWEKIIQENNEKYKHENHYGNNIAEKKKNLENLGSQIDTKNYNNIDIKEIKNIKNKDNIDKDESKEKDKKEESKEIDINNKKEEDLKESNAEIQKDNNENYQFLTIKNILDNNSLLKKDY